ncbi:MAG: alginate export family protein [Candidatus Cloacimonetes bacterium]|nr:alginate export family protein [Candidatus Cloacimonadota bacterium]
MLKLFFLLIFSLVVQANDANSLLIQEVLAELKELRRENQELKARLDSLENKGQESVVKIQDQVNQLEKSHETVSKNPVPRDRLGDRFHLSGDLRARYEGKSFKPNAILQNEDFIGQRTRFRLDGQITSDTSITLRVLDQREWGSRDGSRVGVPSEFTEFDLAFMELKNVFSRTSVRLGRQELAFADQTLIGPDGWDNRGRTFDAIVFQRDLGKGDFAHLFVSKVDVGPNLKNSGDDSDFSGLYFELDRNSRFKKDVYVLKKRDARIDRHLTHWGFHAEYTKNSWDLMAQAGWQNGSQTGLDFDAHHYKAGLGHTFAKSNNLRVGLERSVSSGDKNPLDTKVQSFDPLFGSNHDKYGIIDLFGNRNLTEDLLTLGWSPTPKSWVRLGYSRFSLTEVTDRIYDDNGNPLPIPNRVVDGKDLGNELSLQYTYMLRPNLALFLGGGRFEADGAVATFLSQADGGKFYYFGSQIGF